MISSNLVLFSVSIPHRHYTLFQVAESEALALPLGVSIPHRHYTLFQADLDDDLQDAMMGFQYLIGIIRYFKISIIVARQINPSVSIPHRHYTLFQEEDSQA